MLGQRVRTLVSETMSGGIHEVEWNGRDGNGNPVASGVYLYRLQVGQESITRRMAIIR